MSDPRSESSLFAASDDETGRHGEQQRRNLRDETVADRQDRIGVRGARHREVVLDHADGEAADEVDEGDDQRGDGVAAANLDAPSMLP